MSEVDADHPPICDVHAHYLSEDVVGRLDQGAARVRLDDVRGVSDAITLNGMPVGATIHQLSSVDGILAEMARTGLERRVLSTPPFTFRYWEEPEEGADLCRALNETLAAVVAEHDEFVGLCTVPLQDTDAAIAEFEYATRELGLTGVTVGTAVGEENLSASGLEPFFATVEAADAPILVHPDFVPVDRLASHYLLNLVGLPVESATALANLVFAGTLDRLPDLRWCFLHGGGAAPYLYGRWEMGWHVRPETRADTPRPPSEYLNHVFCDTLTHSTRALRYLLDVAGSSRVVLGTDSPFDVKDHDPRSHIAGVPDLTEDEREDMERWSPQQWLTGSREVGA